MLWRLSSASVKEACKSALICSPAMSAIVIFIPFSCAGKDSSWNRQTSTCSTGWRVDAACWPSATSGRATAVATPATPTTRPDLRRGSCSLKCLVRTMGRAAMRMTVQWDRGGHCLLVFFLFSFSIETHLQAPWNKCVYIFSSQWDRYVDR